MQAIFFPWTLKIKMPRNAILPKKTWN